jgi:hypothetical protein
MEEMPHFTPMKGMKVDGFYKAQVLKDAVMAASVEPFIAWGSFFLIHNTFFHIMNSPQCEFLLVS